MNESIKAKFKGLTKAHRSEFLDYCIFLLWGEQPFQDALSVFVMSEYLNRPQSPRLLFLIKLKFVSRVLRGAWHYARFHGLADAWLQIAGAYRC